MSLIKLFTTALAIVNSTLLTNPTNLSNTHILTTVTNCDSTSKFNYLNGTLTPETPKINENFTLTIGYKNNYKIVNSGTIDYTLNFNGLPYSFSEPLCSTNLPCPIELGDHLVASNPTSLDQLGKLVMTQKWTSDANDLLLCTKTVVNVAGSLSQNKKLRGL